MTEPGQAGPAAVVVGVPGRVVEEVGVGPGQDRSSAVSPHHDLPMIVCHGFVT